MIARHQLLFSAVLSVVLPLAAGMDRTLRSPPCDSWTGPGSPPCDKGYRGSGHVKTTPKPSVAPSDTAPPPPCMCPMPFPEPFPMPGAGPAPAPAPGPAPGPAPAGFIRRGEVEVLTVDVRLANKVRCNNASLAKDVAKLLNIPVQRVTVTPWSWTMDVPQKNYLAFVQEDHERCDCKVDGGKLAKGRGFRKVKAETDGAAVEWDTSVMTVPEYNAMQGGLHRKSLPEDAGPPPARVQMLTRDPCLVRLLRSQTTYFKKSLAFLLGLPDDKVIIDPPPVKGTVGLLQLSTRVHSESEASQAPFLAVRHCDAAGAAHLHASLLSHQNVPNGAPAPSPLATGAPGPSARDFVVASPIATDTQYVSLAMRLSNINYDMVATNWTFVSSLTTVIKSAIGMSGHIPADAVKVSLFPGSLVVEAMITPPSGTAPSAILAFLDGTVCDETALQLNALEMLSPFKAGTIDCTVQSLSLEDSPVPEDESNRAWIAFWSVVILPPFAEEGAWRLLNLVNEEYSDVSKLLPLTLARVPGLKYRSLKEPNAVNETRLPPPEDKAVGFMLPDPYDQQEVFRVEAERMQREEAAAVHRLQIKSAMEIHKAQKELGVAQQMRESLKRADVQFTNAARVHAQILTTRQLNASDVAAPDIMPYDVITDPDDAQESPYSWPEEEPLGLVQEPPASRSLRGGMEHEGTKHYKVLSMKPMQLTFM